MRKLCLLFVAAACAGLVVGCSSKSDDRNTDKPKKPKKTKRRKKPKTAVKRTLEPRPVSCLRVLRSRPVTKGSGSVKVTLAGKQIKAVYDPQAVYRQNPVWVHVNTPPACGMVKKDGTMSLVAFFEAAGKPMLRLQVLRSAGGRFPLGDVRLMTGQLHDGGLKWDLRFTKGRMTIAPKALVPGRVTIRISGASGEAMSPGKRAAFTLEATFTGNIPEDPSQK